MTQEPSPPAPRQSSALATVVLVVGVLVAATSGLCTGTMVVMPAGDSSGYGPVIAIFAVIIGLPLILLGLGLTALGRRMGDTTAGDPPLWHRIVGWCLMIVSGLMTLGAVAGFVNMAGIVLTEGGAPEAAGGMPTGVIMLLGFIASAAIPIAGTALAFWLGLTLIRPRR